MNWPRWQLWHWTKLDWNIPRSVIVHRGHIFESGRPESSTIIDYGWRLEGSRVSSGGLLYCAGLHWGDGESAIFDGRRPEGPVLNRWRVKRLLWWDKSLRNVVHLRVKLHLRLRPKLLKIIHNLSCLTWPPVIEKGKRSSAQAILDEIKADWRSP